MQQPVPFRSCVAVSTQLYTCYVLAEHHGTGAASQLITDLLGAESASLWVFEGNPRARRFYEKHGFKVIGVHENYYKKIVPHDAWILEKRLHTE